MKHKFDTKTFGLIVGMALLGAIWAAYNLISTGGVRSEAELRPLVWAYFATPCALFLGWVIARRVEVWRAAGICFCVYFFTPFVAARIESLVLSSEQAAANGHSMFFWTMISLHLVVAVGLATWRALSGPVQPAEAAEPAMPGGSAGLRPQEE